MTRVQTIAVLLLILASVGTPLAAAQEEQPPKCSTVVHDVFRTNNATMSKLANGTQVQSTAGNTRVTINESNTFYQVHAANPNGYCVKFVVEVGEKAIPPAELPGSITSNDGEYEATWDAIYDFESQGAYTRIVFTILPGESTTFAPSEIRVVSLSWASERVTKSQGVLANLSDRFGWGEDEPLTERHYTIEPDASNVVTVPLENPQTDERIEEWYASYSTDGGETWRPVKTETNAPVFYQLVNNETAVKFSFENDNATVKFVANPTRLDEAKREYEYYMAGISELVDVDLPFLIAGGTA